jgi:NADPH:quinone reductase-like Zn-dependent oxidoreductase
MRTMAVDEFGPVEGLRLVELPVPQPGEGELRVRVVASAVNAADYKITTGTGQPGFIHARSFPLVVGYDFSGTVDAVGARASGLVPGDAVFGHLPYSPRNRRGAFAEYLVTSAGAVGRKPPEVSHEAAAAGATAGLTALQALRDKGRLGAGQRALIAGAAGGVGSVAIGVARRLGASVTAISSSEAAEFVRGLGADRVLERSAAGGPLRQTEERHRVFFDTPAAYSFRRCRHLLAPGGTYVTTLPSLGLLADSVAALASSRRCRLIVVRSVPADLETLAGWIAEGMEVPIQAIYPVRDAALAIAEIHRSGRRGRLVVQVADGW